MQRCLRVWIAGAVLLSLVLLAAGTTVLAQDKPLRIGLGMALTGGLAGNGKAALLAMQIWAEEVNQKGGLLGRQVQLVYYDDQTKPANIPPIYTKLLDVDKVDFVISGYGTNLIAPAMPIVMERGLVWHCAHRTHAADGRFQGFLRDCQATATQDHGTGRGGCGVCAELAEWRPRKRQDVWLSNRLRQDLPTEHH
jgi:hypothetical protein